MPAAGATARTPSLLSDPQVKAEAEDLLDTTAGLALANAAYGEGLSAGIRACNDAKDGEPFRKPESPYSAPLLRRMKQ